MPSKPRWWSDAETSWKCTASLTLWNCSTPAAQRHIYSFFYMSNSLHCHLSREAPGKEWFWPICPYNIIRTCIMQDAHLLSAWAPSVSDSLAKFLTKLHFELVLHCFFQSPDLWCPQTMTRQTRGAFQLFSLALPPASLKVSWRSQCSFLHSFQWEQERIDKKTTFFYYS